VAAEDPLEGDAPAGEGDDVLVAVLELGVGEELARAIREAELFGTTRHELLEQLRRVVADQVSKAREQRMGMSGLRRAATLPVFEGLVVARGEGRRVCLDNGHAVAAARERERDSQSRDRSADHDECWLASCLS
jgi:hypothetical protein